MEIIDRLIEDGLASKNHALGKGMEPVIRPSEVIVFRQQRAGQEFSNEGIPQKTQDLTQIKTK